jgi:hypothetical protein
MAILTIRNFNHVLIYSTDMKLGESSEWGFVRNLTSCVFKLSVEKDRTVIVGQTVDSTSKYKNKKYT